MYSPQQQLIAKLKANPLSFGKVIMPDMFSDKSPPFHKAMIKAYLDPTTNKVNIQAPRGHAKTSVMGGIVPLHHLIFGPTKTKFIILISKTQKHAKRLLLTIKNTLEYSENFRKLFGYYGEHSASKWTDEEIHLKDGSVIAAFGTGQQIRGLKNIHQRPTLIILDDPEDENNTKTAEAMKANLDWLLKGLDPAVDIKHGKIIVIGTPLHQLCMVESLRNYKRWKSLHFSAELDPDRKLSLWPERYPWTELQAIRQDYETNNRLSVYFQEYLCSIIPDDDRLFKPEYMRYYTLVSLNTNNPRKATITFQKTDKNGLPHSNPETHPCSIFCGIDPATSTNAKADYTVILSIAIIPDGRILVLPYIRARMAPSDTIEAIVKHYKRYKPIITSLEATGAQETFRDILRKRKDVNIPGLNVKHLPKESKKKRHLDVLEPPFSQFLITIQPSMKTLYEEAITHPKGRHDDILDGLYYATLRAQKPKHTQTSPNELTPKKPKTDTFMGA